LQLKQTKIGFNIVSDRRQISHDLGFSLERSDTEWTKSDCLSDETLGATLGSVSVTRGINWELMPDLPLDVIKFVKLWERDGIKKCKL